MVPSSRQVTLSLSRCTVRLSPRTNRQSVPTIPAKPSRRPRRHAGSHYVSARNSRPHDLGHFLRIHGRTVPHGQMSRSAWLANGLRMEL
ncbi:hypothetical protein GMOD_00004846 [Pyrenophora seminiperda CCB06]|uniref:Uncharacterized protein n=1 Tax=Pyrenophora seminiperda CCB06 TaxID=1302712 RepID=A0A3M7MHP3_9PLEO|nr:hypothetical protein GMOD_00004846 [Pyrenophora seminiperda CCB06]